MSFPESFLYRPKKIKMFDYVFPQPELAANASWAVRGATIENSSKSQS